MKLSGLRFRPNPHYALRKFDDLPAPDREMLGIYADDAEIWGALVPIGDDRRTIKLVGHDLARLHRHLAGGGRTLANLGVTFADEEVLDLVGAEVLEVEVAGRFVSGIEALSYLRPTEEQPISAEPASLSLEAIEYAISLRIDDQRAVADRLYSYNRIAIRDPWRTLEAETKLAENISAATLSHPATARAWTQISARPWKAFVSSDGYRSREQPMYKMYISPTMQYLPDVASVVTKRLSTTPGVVGWKIANCIEAAARPDKYVVYAETRAVITALAGELCASLNGVRAHGVPFTCAAGADGLLSWGVDPPNVMSGASGLVDSWRTWVAARLADGVVQSSRAGLTHAQARDAVLRRARVAGVDTITWAPTPELLNSFDQAAV